MRDLPFFAVLCMLVALGNPTAAQVNTANLSGAWVTTIPTERISTARLTSTPQIRRCWFRTITTQYSRASLRRGRIR